MAACTALCTALIAILIQTESCLGAPRCLPCPPGEGAVGCRLCTPCPDGWYSPSVSRAPCTPCTTCAGPARTRRPCTPTEDAVCETCKSGSRGRCDGEFKVKSDSGVPQAVEVTKEEPARIRNVIEGERYDVRQHHGYVMVDLSARRRKRRRMLRSLSDADLDTDSNSENNSEGASSSDDESLDDIMEQEGLIVHRTRNDGLLYTTLSPGQGDLGTDQMETGSGEELAFLPSLADLFDETSSPITTTAAPSGEDSLTELVSFGFDEATQPEWSAPSTGFEDITAAPSSEGTDFTDWSDALMNATEVMDSESVTGAMFDVTVTLADDEFNRPPFNLKETTHREVVNPTTAPPPEKSVHSDESMTAAEKREVLDEATSGQTSTTATVVIVIGILALVGIVIAVTVFIKRKQKRKKALQRNGDYLPTSAEESAREMEVLNKSRDDELPPDASTESTPLNRDMEPEVEEDAANASPEHNT